MLIRLWPRNLPLYLPMSVLFLQTASPLLIRHTRRLNTDETSPYHPASVTLLAELCKVLVAFGSIYRTIRGQQLEATSLEIFTTTVRNFASAIQGSR